MSARRIASVVGGFVLLLIVSGLWLFRYAPLGSFTGNGGGVYVCDRLTGNILWMVGNNIFVVKPFQQSAQNSSGDVFNRVASDRTIQKDDISNKLPIPVTDPELIRQLENKPLVPEGFVLDRK